MREKLQSNTILTMCFRAKTGAWVFRFRAWLGLRLALGLGFSLLRGEVAGRVVIEELFRMDNSDFTVSR